MSAKSALVFGASDGIGKGIAMGLASEGKRLVLVSRNTEGKLKETQKKIIDNTGNEEIKYFTANMCEQKDVTDAVDYALRELGTIDILINNTGGPQLKRYDEIDSDEWRKVFDSIFLSAVIPTSIITPYMEKQNWGRIVTVTSTVTKEPTPNMMLSSTIRAAVTTYMKCLSRQVANRGVTVNVAAPGGVETQRIKDLAKYRAKDTNKTESDIINEDTKNIPIERLASTEEFANYVLFLCSNKASYITGTSLNIDGGLSRGTF